MRRRQRGFTLMEIVIALSIFGVFVFVLVELTADMMHYERKYPVNFMTHPQVSAVISRLRRDVEDTTFPFYETDKDTFHYGPKILILYVLTESGGAQDVVWDFSHPGEVHRYSYNVGLMTEWVARGLPDFEVDTFEIPGKPYSTHIKAYSQGGTLAVDQIFTPRPHPST